MILHINDACWAHYDQNALLALMDAMTHYADFWR